MRNLVLTTLFIVFGATSALADGAQCLKFRSLGRELCRDQAAVAAVGGDGHLLAWGGKESRGCDQCTRMVTGNATGGLYDTQGRLVESMSQVNSPGPRFGAEALWNGAAFFVWGGLTRQNERWLGDHHEVVNSVRAQGGAFYVPGSRTWTRMSPVGSPASDGKLSLSAEGAVQVCDAMGCKAFDMVTNTWH